MNDSLRAVIPDDTIERWKRATATTELADRLRIVAAPSPDAFPADADQRSRCRFDYARQVAWEAYVDTAKAIGLLDADLIERLRSVDADMFRPAMAECMTASYLVDDLQLRVSARPPGRNRSMLEMVIEDDHGTIAVEVKSPRMPDRPRTAGPLPSENEQYEATMRAANRQFSNSGRNLLVVVPRRQSMFGTLEHQLMRALIGEHVISFDIDRHTGRLVGESRSAFRTNGRFTRGRQPMYKRIGAVVCLEEVSRTRFPSAPDVFFRDFSRVVCTEAQLQEANERFFSDANVARVEHAVLVVHNPFANEPIDPAMFADARQLIPTGDGMRWVGQRPY